MRARAGMGMGQGKREGESARERERESTAMAQDADARLVHGAQVSILKRPARKGLRHLHRCLTYHLSFAPGPGPNCPCTTPAPSFPARGRAPPRGRGCRRRARRCCCCGAGDIVGAVVGQLASLRPGGCAFQSCQTPSRCMLQRLERRVDTRAPPRKDRLARDRSPAAPSAPAPR